MTPTTATQPLDLDKLYAVAFGGDSVDEYLSVFNPATILALIAQARVAQPAQTGIALDAESFEAWLEREMPAGTVIGNPTWWARRISARASLAAAAAQQAAAVAGRDAALETAVQAVAERAGDSETIRLASAFDAIRALKANRHALPERHAPATAGAATTGEDTKPLARGHREDYYLMANARRLAEKSINSVMGTTNWSFAAQLFATGCNSAHQICIDAGIDPCAYKVECGVPPAAGNTAQPAGE